ncbi:death-associated inhibitor of apoptosis 1 [Drosophila grimshawi]|uniref:GH15404 n=1 Tax=Drosophila grimshawi TaxID=7222 RepID=B4J320_DROGR|nr:death-associated inhibitor of apoptosis 1 [Drosophila grimshawi]XP_032599432.1 death-associated inhibitor of apoptosis 1 [Drosophila grimshawi]XP_032599433.1 death-associated inhibitor of apoptosis 1 [Drosophila grimshawi]EDV96091.1 GH15404 [Drosophila grimshawi]
MANIASQTRSHYTPYGSMTISSAIPAITTTITASDQVDDSTNASRLLKLYRMNEKYQREDERLKTYTNWPVPFLDCHTLAKTGMYFTNEDDKVKCYFCEVEIGRWEPGDQPVSEHLRWSPNCPLLRRRPTNNIPISAEALDAILPPISYDICGSNNSVLEVHDTAYSEGRQSDMQSTSAISSTPAEVFTSLQPCSRPQAGASSGGSFYPASPEYAIETARLRSFADWPLNMKQKPQQLAEAGFYYTGVGDRVRCFSCGGGLKDWDDQDEPWEQHALWLKQCRYVKLIMGQRFVDAVAEKAAAARQGEQDAVHKPECNDDEEQQQQLLSTNATSTVTAASDTAPIAVAAASPAAIPATMECGDVVPAAASTAASRIHEKMMSQDICSEGAAGEKTLVREEKLCKICYAEEYNTAFLPCGHVVACAKCASSVTKCPLCRKPFTDVMRVYFS